MSGGLAVYWTGDVRKDFESEGRGQGCKLIGDDVANGLGLRGGDLVDLQLGLQYIGDSLL